MVKTIADQIYINGKIYTIDSNNPWVEGLALRDGKFLRVGMNQDVLSYRGDNTEVVNLNGLMTMPGVHDAHTHLLEASLRPSGYHCDLEDPQSLDELAEQLTSYREKNSHQEWLIAGIYNSLILTDKMVTKEFLDDLFPVTPVIVYDFTAVHGCQVNTKALEIASINKDTPNPPGGSIIKNSKTGEPTGLLTEAATALVRLKAPKHTREVVINCLKYATQECAKYGITSVQEASTTKIMLESLKRLEDNNELYTHVFTHLLYNFPALSGWGTDAFDEAMEVRNDYRGRYIHPDGVKIFLDGTSLPPHFTHVPLDPETDEPVTYNLMIPYETLEKRLLDWSNQGLKVKAHCSGIGAVRIGLNKYEEAQHQSANSSYMHDIAHARYISPKDYIRFKENNIVAELSPAIWHFSSLKDSLKGAFSFKTLTEKGVLVTIGSDWILPKNPNLFPGLGGILLHGQESVSLEVALKMMTINGAKSVGKDKEWGSIEEGKDATFIVLDRNLFDSTPEEIQNTNVLKTTVQGRAVYKDNNFNKFIKVN